MEFQNTTNSKKYLSKFYNILSEMTIEMLSNKPTDNITKYFIKCMVPHHQAAIYMCENLLKYTNYEPLQNIAEGIIKMQTKGIKQMKEIYKVTRGYTNSLNDVKSYTNKYLEITQTMINKMKNSSQGNDINLDFISEMIPHHEGAIAMCQNLLKYYIDPRLRSVADTIIKEQSQGVEELKQIEKKLCN